MLTAEIFVFKVKIWKAFFLTHCGQVT